MIVKREPVPVLADGVTISLPRDEAVRLHDALYKALAPAPGQDKIIAELVNALTESGIQIAKASA